ncbi:hypothetical protein [Xenorhabdus szentirmaii]|uniref:Uncharacterized protein n=2 Tax=Xenorhabdus szentirmaii TaxID=290112 RepID=W1J5G5_9GAMM|nr:MULTISPECIES: hypothetical protein [Xenorhabdus]MBD2805174.1 hypothetical protein [Xenorhabdus sp. ZM]PHM35432.1 hypothetical protein Xsze_01903 [Xenorhabdus szentirmaii DSM 16338]CDL84710.1 conserved hypothetical protein [Xenorhabdus szentirmaii DSM 16338]
MSNDFYFRLDILSKELDDFYTKEYLSEQEEYLKNKEIKSCIVDLILEAKACNETQLIKKALFLIFDHTGCQQDVEILNEIFVPLIDEKIITQECIDQELQENSPLARWY